jgi:nitroreductase
MEKEHSMGAGDLLDLIKRRRSVFPPAYNGKEIEREVIEEILEAGQWAPNHYRTEPWRFHVIQGEAKKRLGEFIAEFYKGHALKALFSEARYNKKLRNPQLSAAVIAICMKANGRLKPPYWEEIAAVSCAVQNMWLMCTARGIGAYWGTPGVERDAGEFLDLQEGEECLGFFFMGYTDEPWPEGKREGLEGKVVWMDT